MNNTPSRRAWLGVPLAVGAAYFVVGWVVGTLTSSAVWKPSRLAAWVISGAIFIAQIAHERIRLRSNASATALHAGGAAAIGGFLLAVAATVNKSLHGGADARYLLALLVWPLIVAVPAWGAALIASALIRPARHPIPRSVDSR